jgi:hypothetical protein
MMGGGVSDLGKAGKLQAKGESNKISKGRRYRCLFMFYSYEKDAWWVVNTR